MTTSMNAFGDPPAVFGARARAAGHRPRLIVLGSFGSPSDLLVFAPLAALLEYVDPRVVVTAGDDAREHVALVRAGLAACGAETVPVLSAEGCPAHPALPEFRYAPAEQPPTLESQLEQGRVRRNEFAVVLSGGAQAAVDRFSVVAMAPEDIGTSDACDTCRAERAARDTLRRGRAYQARDELSAFARNLPLPEELAWLLARFALGGQRAEPIGPRPPRSVVNRQRDRGFAAVGAVLVTLRHVIQGQRDRRPDVEYWSDVLAAGLLAPR